MKKLCLFSLLTVAIFANGCIWESRHATAPAPARAGSKFIVTPDLSLAAKVVLVNAESRFVILNFPPDTMPKPQQTLFLYRAGLKVAEVRANDRQAGENIVADIVTGEARVGDAVRDQ